MMDENTSLSLQNTTSSLSAAAASAGGSCCSWCPHHGYCSPVSHSCYHSKRKGYYHSCSWYVAPNAIMDNNASLPLQNIVESDNESHMQDAKGTLDSLSSHGGCLCVFDIDCTLSTRPHGSVHLSSMGHGFRSSFCGRCHIAAITAGSWRHISGIGQIVAGCDGGCKAHRARSIAHSMGVHSTHVYFFDDHARNVAAFRGTGMNARQVSCGRCGASRGEIQRSNGVSFCR